MKKKKKKTYREKLNVGDFSSIYKCSPKMDYSNVLKTPATGLSL